MGRIGAIVAARDVVESAVDRRNLGVDERRKSADFLAEDLVDAGGESGPQRSDGAGTADHGSLSVNVNVVAGDRVGISGNIRNAAADEMAGIDGSGHVCVGLIGGLGEKLTDATAGGALLICHFVPDGFAAVLIIGGGEFGAAAGEGERAGGWEVNVLEVVGDAVRRTVVARSDTDGYTEGRGIF